MRDSFGEVACLDSQPHLPPCDSALMRVAAYGFVFFIYENPFPGSRYMHIDPHNSIYAPFFEKLAVQHCSTRPTVRS